MGFSDELYHYGVLGMKWGVRRSQEELDRKAGRYKEKEQSKANKKYAKEMQRVITRRDKRIKKGKNVELDNDDINRLKANKDATDLYFKNFNYRKYRKEKSDLNKQFIKNLLLTSVHTPSLISFWDSKTNYRVNEVQKEYSNKKKRDKYINDIKQAKKRYKKLELEIDKTEDDYYNSEVVKKDSAVAYQKTLNWYKKNQPDVLYSITKKNGGKTTGLDSYHDFRKIYEGYADETQSAGLKKFKEARGIDKKEDELRSAYEDYEKAIKKYTQNFIDTADIITEKHD